MENRIKQDWERWQELEKSLERLVPGTLKSNMPFQQDTVAFYQFLETKYAGEMSREEQVTLRSLSVHRDAAIRLLYPNPLIRLVRNILKPIRTRRPKKHLERQDAAQAQNMSLFLSRSGFSEANSQVAEQMRTDFARYQSMQEQTMSSALTHMCFNEVNSQVAEQMRLEKESFSIPVSTYVNERERVDYELYFGRDRQDQYFLDYYTAAYTNGTEKRVHKFNSNQDITAQQAYHLMAGRALAHENANVPWKTEQWIQLDFNDKDSNGNYRMKILNKDGSYKPEELLLKLGIKGDLSRFGENLKNGEQIEVAIKGSKYLLEANPHHKTLNVYDMQGNKYNIESILSKRQQNAKLIALHPEAPKTKETKSKRLKH